MKTLQELFELGYTLVELTYLEIRGVIEWNEHFESFHIWDELPTSTTLVERCLLTDMSIDVM